MCTCVHTYRYPHTFLPVSQGYDISFLVTNFQTEQMYKHKLVDFVIHVSLLCAIDVTVVILGILVCKCAELIGSPLCTHIRMCFVQREPFVHALEYMLFLGVLCIQRPAVFDLFFSLLSFSVYGGD